MPTHEVIGGAAAYVDADGLHRWAQNGDVIDFTASEAERLMGLGMLRDPEAEAAAAKAEEDALAAARAAEDQARADEAARIAGEAGSADKVPKGPTVAQLEDAADNAGVDRTAASTRQELWDILPAEARAEVTG